MKVKELIELLKTMNADAPVVVHGFLGGFDDAEFVTSVSLACNVYKSETWRGKHESLVTLKRYQKKAISSRTISSDLRKLITAVDDGSGSIDLMKAVCLSGVSTLPISHAVDNDAANENNPDLSVATEFDATSIESPRTANAGEAKAASSSEAKAASSVGTKAASSSSLKAAADSKAIVADISRPGAIRSQVFKSARLK